MTFRDNQYEKVFQKGVKSLKFALKILNGCLKQKENFEEKQLKRPQYVLEFFSKAWQTTALYQIPAKLSLL